MFTLASCEDLDSSSSQIIDETGISISLEWNVVNSTGYGPDEADLDLRLLKDQALVNYSTGAFTYEQLDFSSSLADGYYEIEVTTDAIESVDYTLRVEGLSTSESLYFHGSFPSSTGPYQVIPFSINKTEGGNFTLN